MNIPGMSLAGGPNHRHHTSVRVPNKSIYTLCHNFSGVNLCYVNVDIGTWITGSFILTKNVEVFRKSGKEENLTNSTEFERLEALTMPEFGVRYHWSSQGSGQLRPELH
jgi:hypothetical protein